MSIQQKKYKGYKMYNCIIWHKDEKDNKKVTIFEPVTNKVGIPE